MTFSIEFIRSINHSEKDVGGLLRINGHEEQFRSPLTYWNIDDYMNQWKIGISRVRQGKASCLITAIENPKHFHFGEWWLLYVRNGRVLLQNHLLLRELFEQPFDPENPYSFIPEYESTTEEGDLISEWQLSMTDFLC
jgi:hypothetical protein